jgi:NADH dehydrogenase
VVVGGGYTGFEVASHVAYRLHMMTGRPYRELRRLCSITIVEKAPEVLRNVSPRVREWAVQIIHRFGVEVRTRCSVEAFAEDGVTLSDGSRLERAVVAWCAGVTPGSPVAELDAPRTRGGRLEVDECLCLPGAANVFAAGDVAGATLAGEEGPLRMAIQFSLAEGRCAAGNALRTLDRKPLQPFRATDLGYLVPLAPGRAAGVVLGWEGVGRLPSALHYAMCSIRSWSWANRLGIPLDLMRGGGA